MMNPRKYISHPCLPVNHMEIYDGLMKYVDDIVNPILEARLNDGYSLKRLGKRLGISAQYISRAEHATYSDLNGALTNYAADVLAVTPIAVMNRYRNFQNETRRRTARNIQPKKLVRGISVQPGHVLFAEWRSIYWPSPVAFSNAFCVHPDVVTMYEDGIRTTMPDQVKRALEMVRLLDDDWSEAPIPGQRKLSAFGPVAKRQVSESASGANNNVDSANSSSTFLIPIPGQRSQEPF